jgi:hypothetical protein
MRGSGLVLPRAQPLLAPLSIFRDNVEALAVAESQVIKEKLANQMYYGWSSKSGTFYGYGGYGYGGASEAFNQFISWKSATDPLWIVPFKQPTTKVWFVKEETGGGPEETLATGPAIEKLQKEFEAVPVPFLSKVPHGQIQQTGTDATAVIWQPATDTLWEIHRFGRFASGPHQGEWKAGYGHRQTRTSEWNGVCASETGLQSASGLSAICGDILLSDLVRVLRGGKIGHALKISIPVVANEHVAPAVSHDASGPYENTHEFLADGKTANPAYGTADAIPEGSWFRFPPASRATEYGLTQPLAVALYEAIREHGLVVSDRGGNPSLRLCDPRTLFTPYCDTNFNAMQGSSQFNPYIEEGTSESTRNGWVDETLPVLEGELNGSSGILVKMPWRTLELLKPRSS